MASLTYHILLYIIFDDKFQIVRFQIIHYIAFINLTISLIIKRKISDRFKLIVIIVIEYISILIQLELFTIYKISSQYVRYLGESRYLTSSRKYIKDIPLYGNAALMQYLYYSNNIERVRYIIIQVHILG